jgi:hypothetical protein
MANLHLRFFDKQGDPLNFAYVGPTGSANLDTSYLYYSTNSGSSPADGYISLQILTMVCLSKHNRSN